MIDSICFLAPCAQKIRKQNKKQRSSERAADDTEQQQSTLDDCIICHRFIKMKFSSEGYDLDAVNGNNSDSSDVVLEVGAGASVVIDQNSASGGGAAFDEQQQQNQIEKEKDENTVLMEMADDYKFQGNEAFKAKEYEKALELYSAAIRVTPGLTGREILKLEYEWQEQERKR